MRLLPPPPVRRTKSFRFEVRFAGNWQTENSHYLGRPTAPGLIGYEFRRHHYMGFETGPALEGSVSLMVSAFDEAEAVRMGVERVEAMPAFYPGFLNDATAYELSVAHEGR